MFAVTVTFTIKPLQTKYFLYHIAQNAQTSLQTEPGCQQFDVCHDSSGTTVFLYEIYDTRAAFEAHMTTAHFKAFEHVTAQMIDTKEVRLFEKVIR